MAKKKNMYLQSNALVPLFAGIGIGFLLAYPIAGSHPVRWSIGFIGLAVLGYFWKMK